MNTTTVEAAYSSLELAPGIDAEGRPCVLVMMRPRSDAKSCPLSYPLETWADVKAVAAALGRLAIYAFGPDPSAPPAAQKLMQAMKTRMDAEDRQSASGLH